MSMFPIKEVSKVDMAFGGDIKQLMPAYKDIPERFRNMNGKEQEIASQWFFSGLPEGTEFIPREGVDANKALRHIAAILQSWEPKHEHKMAGVSYLLDQWFSEIRLPETAGDALEEPRMLLPQAD